MRLDQMKSCTYDIPELDISVNVIADECKLNVLMGRAKHRLDEARVDYSIQCHLDNRFVVDKIGNERLI